MELNPIEWNEAQNLLLKLVQALSPLAISPVAPSMFLSRRFFIPPSVTPAADFFQRHPVKLLVTLHEVQKEVEEWIAEPEKNGAPEESRPAAAATRPATKIASERQVEKPVSKEKPQTRELSKPEEEKTVPLVRQAKELIHQVQEAIGKLSNSTYIQEPQEAPLRELLKKLKPSLDRIVDSFVSAEEKTQAVQPFRHALPIPARQEIIKKLHTFKKEERPLPTASTQPKPSEKVDLPAKTDPIRRFERSQITLTPVQEKENIPTQAAVVKEKPVKKQKAAEKTVEQERTGEPVKKSEEAAPVRFNVRIEKTEPPPAKQDLKPVSLPLMVFESKRAAAPRKKKKRKGFWFKDGEEQR